MKTAITVNTKEVRFPAAPDLYGLFFEDINRAADGGLYPEMLRNRAFEDSLPPAGCGITPGGEVFCNEGGWPGSFACGEGMEDWVKDEEPTPVPAWYGQGCEFALDTGDVLNASRLAALQVRFAAGGALRNVGYGGISVAAGEEYALHLFIRSEQTCTLTAGFCTRDGRVLGEAPVDVVPGEGYRQYACIIAARESGDRVYFQLSCGEAATMKLGFTSLLPCRTYLNHGLREDLVEALKNTHSRFLRFPGGCVVEGINDQNTMSFSKTIGPVWERPSSFLMWHYRTTNGLGYHEYLQLCEDLDMAAMYVCNCGISCQARNGRGFSPERTAFYLEEALGAIEYALGGTETKYGAMRAANGHAKPFPLVYLEIGNENFGPDYDSRYQQFYEAIHQRYPGLKLIANDHVERRGHPAQMVDEHYYNTPEYFVENRTLFDGYDRQGPEIFLGEYAVNGGNTIASLECALAEAVFLTGVEKNQDIVRLSAYAPLLQNARYAAWLPNLIVFDQTRVYGIPTYHMISLLARYRGQQVLTSRSEGDAIPPRYFGIPGIMCKKEGLQFRNVRINGRPAEISRKIYGDVAEQDGVYRMISGTARHRYIGKNQVWNEAFERFIGAGPEKDNPVLWMGFGDRRMEACDFEAELKFEPDNPVTLSVWNHDPQTDVGCNEPRDMSWNMRSVRNQIWKIADGKSMLRSPHYYEQPLREEEVRPIALDYSRFNHFRIVARPGQYQCYLNGELIQEKTLPLLPLVSEAATADAEQVYVKLVNISEEPNTVALHLDCEVEKDYRIAYIQGRPEDVNSFEEPGRIAVREEERTGAGKDFSFELAPCCVCVLILRKA